MSQPIYGFVTEVRAFSDATTTVTYKLEGFNEEQNISLPAGQVPEGLLFGTRIAVYYGSGGRVYIEEAPA